ncbi:hypothetical protein GCM10009838_75710 [Catenulispora subtropica]|uniref:DUF4034 domain-containing protein n=2 Tax=Catenulispora subtropica TaxID=450798 RepID=A0ABP5EJ25_9ACTN
MALFRKGKKTQAPAVGSGSADPAATAFDAAGYGLVPDSAIALDVYLGDSRLAAASKACLQNDWTVADRLLDDVGGDWDTRFLYVGVIADSAKNDDSWLQAWLAAQPESANAAVVHASALHALASSVRGGQAASLTTREQFEGFHRISREADDAAARAAELAPDDPSPWVIRIISALGRQIPHDEFRPLFAEAARRAPLHRRAHTYAHQYWLAKWFGSDELAERFVLEETARAPKSAMAFELRIHYAQELWLRNNLDKRPEGDISTFYRTGPGRPLLDEALDAFWTGEVPAGGGLGTIDQNLLAWALYQTERYDEACDVWTAVGGSMSGGYPWQYYKDKAGVFRLFRQRSFLESSRKPVATATHG